MRKANKVGTALPKKTGQKSAMPALIIHKEVHHIPVPVRGRAGPMGPRPMRPLGLARPPVAGPTPGPRPTFGVARMPVAGVAPRPNPLRFSGNPMAHRIGVRIKRPLG